MSSTNGERPLLSAETLQGPQWISDVFNLIDSRLPTPCPENDQFIDEQNRCIKAPPRNDGVALKVEEVSPETTVPNPINF